MPGDARHDDPRRDAEGFPGSATPSSPARAACPAVSIQVSMAASARAIMSAMSPKIAARMAAALAVEPHRFLTAYQIHSPDVVVAEEPWASDARPRADAIVTCAVGLAIGVSTADCGPVLFADAKRARDRRRACRLARPHCPACSKRPSPPWSGSALRAAAFAQRSGR